MVAAALLAVVSCRPTVDHAKTRTDSASAAFSSVVAWSVDSVIVLWGAHDEDIEGVAFSPDSRRLATADNGGRVVLLDEGSIYAVAAGTVIPAKAGIHSATIEQRWSGG